jgi:serine/threonine protein kinase
MIGTKLAHYEITSHLGTGGMGEVYQATDSKLGRSVAIKLLPQVFAQDAERVARFRREARVLASLNHPNIAAIHGLEEANGRNFLVMELVPGETLAKRIARGPIPIDESLTLARQISEALEAAHEKGILHRDLKPANIKVTPGGQVKVLDFGLAKILEDKSADVHLSAPTMRMSGTLGGVILGTAAYMSPEQARGMEVGRTSDVWAFGCVLFEMLTGRQAFSGHTVTDILGAILKLEPDWHALPERTPAGIRKLLSRCLQKERKNRLHDIADARIEIEDVPGVQAIVMPARRSWARPLPIAVVVLALAATFAGGWYLHNPREAPEERYEINTPPTANLDSFAVSPDGRMLVFVSTSEGQQRLYLRLLDSDAAEPLTGTEGAIYPFWSPNGQSIGFNAVVAGGALKRIDVAARTLKTVTQAPSDVAYLQGFGSAWGKDDLIVFAPNLDLPLYRFSETSGQSVPVTHLDPPRQTAHQFPQFLPDGQHFLLYAQGNNEGRGVYVGSLQSPGVRRLFYADGPAVFVSPGYLIFIRQGALLAQRFDTRKLDPVGDPVTVAPHASFVSAAANVIAYRTQKPKMLTWFDRSGKTMGTIGKEGDEAPEISPDGNSVAIMRTTDGNTDVWIIDATGGTGSPLTTNPAMDSWPIWSSDGKKIVFSSTRGHEGQQDLYMKSIAGAGGEALLSVAPEKGFLRALRWPPDGRLLYFGKYDPRTLWRIHALPLTGDGKPAGEPSALLANNSSTSELDARFSPDGRWVAYQSNESGKYEIYVQLFPGPGSKTQVSFGGGTQVRWPAEAKELFYVGPDGKLIAVPMTFSADGTVVRGTPAVIAPNLQVVSQMLRQGYDVSSNGQRILVSAPPDDQQTPPIRIIRNWKPPVK